MLHLLGLAVLARLLSPEDYGLMAMVAVVIGLGELLRDFGLSSAAVQAPSLTHEQRSNLFWTNSAIGVGAGVLVLLLAGPVARFYGEPALLGMTQALAVVFLLSGPATQYRADLNRQMRFGALATVEVTAQAIGLATGVVAALAGAGYWSLVLQHLGQAAVTLPMLVLAVRWCPGRPRTGTDMRPFLRFGVGLMASQLLTFASRNVDTLVIGSRLGPTALGVYDRAWELMSLPLNQVGGASTQVALPVLARVQHTPEQLHRLLLTGQRMVVTALVGLLAFMASQAPAVVAVVLGDRWEDSAGILQVLLVAGVFQALSQGCYWYYLATGATGVNLTYSAVSRSMLIVVVVVTVHWGVMAVAWGYAATLAVMWPFGMWWAHRFAGAPSGALMRGGARSLVAWGAAATASWATFVLLPGTGSWAALLLGGAAAAATATVLALLWPAFRSDLGLLLRSLGAVSRRRSGRSALAGNDTTRRRRTTV